MRPEENNLDDWNQLFCHDLPSDPVPEIGTVLVTGASGYIGGRLVPELLARGYRVRIMVRSYLPEYEKQFPGCEVAVADAMKEKTLDAALEGVTAAYYLIHSLLLGPEKFARADREAASNFRRAAERQNVSRIIYLGGLGDVAARLSPHLRSRIEVAEELRSGEVEVTILRAAVIIGSGSASYEIIKNLVMKVPVFVLPRGARSRCQPISIRDVIKYLVGVLEVDKTSGRTFDIGGDEVMTYLEMLRKTASVLQKKRFFIQFQIFNISIYSYFVSLLTPVPGPITRCLLEGIKNDVVCREDSIKSYLDFPAIEFEEAILRALSREEQDRVRTRWSNAYPPSHELAMKLDELENEPEYSARYGISSEKSSEHLFRSLCRVGGAEGWFHNNWLWRIRGAIDRIFMGVGTSRGRRESASLGPHDVIDFWRVEKLERNSKMLLRAEMKLPGMAWLDFNIDDRGDTRRLTITAWYHTTSFFGKIYWYFFYPFHHFIFKGLIEQIEKRS
ncbi:MAG: DUF2867 domain-containing protein [Candidatus Latescibacteria bacterium]|nr:DUF2867 domain-containing protein [bacterium]MBD3424835.1 DUF2867 domain-containing protein [Candidatus Latescibacterota bacterium]